MQALGDAIAFFGEPPYLFKTTAAFIILELRRQVDHQVTAAASVDTKAAGLIAATLALFALVVPRIVVATAAQVVVGVVTIGLVIATLGLLTLAIKPRVRAFSYGPDAQDMMAFLDDDDPVDALEEAVARAYRDVRSRNESEIQSKSEALIGGIGFLILTVIGLGAMVVVGGVD